MRKVIISIAISLVVIAVITNVNAATTFLPDWMEKQIRTVGVGYDDPMCAESGLYHQASGCPQPKVFDKYCPYDSDWISECYCPSVFSQICSYPYIGDTRVTDSNSGYASCDGLWVACCNHSCPSGTSRTDPGGCGGYTYSDCGDICYYPFEACCEPLTDETNCNYGTYNCNDGCGGTRTCCKACTPLSNETGCSYGTESCSDGCGGTRTCCKAAPSCTPLSNETGCSYGTESCSDGCGGTRTCCKSDPCVGVSCPTAKSCGYGCALYSSSTSCCSSVCTSCKTKCEADPCAPGCYTDLSCTYGCASTNSCGGCESCKSDPCAGVTCPTAKSCEYGCASYSTATDCCSSVCTSCKSKCEADPCASGCYTNINCAQYGQVCAEYNSCGGCFACKSSSLCPSGYYANNNCCCPNGVVNLNRCDCNVSEAY